MLVQQLTARRPEYITPGSRLVVAGPPAPVVAEVAGRWIRTLAAYGIATSSAPYLALARRRPGTDWAPWADRDWPAGPSRGCGVDEYPRRRRSGRLLRACSSPGRVTSDRLWFRPVVSPGEFRVFRNSRKSGRSPDEALLCLLGRLGTAN